METGKKFKHKYIGYDLTTEEVTELLYEVFSHTYEETDWDAFLQEHFNMSLESFRKVMEFILPLGEAYTGSLTTGKAFVALSIPEDKGDAGIINKAVLKKQMDLYKIKTLERSDKY